ncbi:hypothetical protein BOTNAR_0156g00170 [Botryotinia narcissicola]|uniref:Uncharacterized protein n=1 Tax=Botryotinia narcissicola TaxID=278944 RepID=A0A4Z1IEP6_9HELO|nr:hypothetical protein BOTNAR_0156g00170 [Botryotinia narcissicola]
MSSHNNYQLNLGRGDRSKREDGDKIDESDRSSRVDSQMKMADSHAQIQSLTAQVTCWRDLYIQKIRSDSIGQPPGQQSVQLIQIQDATTPQVAPFSE